MDAGVMIRTRLGWSSEQPPPSLKQLQAIDSDHHALHDKLALLARLLDGEPSNVSHGPAPAHSRIQWALRWLLRRLSSPSDGKEARLKIECWGLLRELLMMLPPSVGVQALLDQSFILLVDQGLQEASNKEGVIPDANPSSPHPSRKRKGESLDYEEQVSKRSKAVSDGEGGDIESSSESPSDASYPESEDGGTQPAHSVYTSPGQTRRPRAGDIFVAISQCLAAVVELIDTLSADSSQTSPACRTNISTALRTDFKRASRILGNGLNMASTTSGPIRMGSSIETTLDPLLRVWTSAEPLNNDDKMVIFIEHVLVPALLLYDEITNPGPGPRWDPSGTIRRLSNRLERLIRKGFLLPVRELHRRAKSADVNKSGSKDANAARKVDFMEPLKKAMRSLDDSMFSRIFRSLHSLFYLEVYSISLRTPKQRLAELPWISQLLESIAELVWHLQYVHPNNSAVIHGTCNTLQQLLGTSHQFKIPAKREFLQGLIATYSSSLFKTRGISTNGLSVIGAASRLDPEALLVDTATADTEKQASVQQALNHLLRYSRERCWVPKQVFTKEEDYTDPCNSPDPSTYIIKSNFIHPLLEAHVSSRNFAKFLQLWYDQLRVALHPSHVFFASPIAENFERRQLDSVWAEVDLYVGVASKVKLALTPKAFCNQVIEFQTRLKSCAKLDTAQRDACLVVLLGLLSDISDPDYIKLIESSLVALIKTCRRLVLKATWEKESRWPAWRVLKVSFLLWISVVKDPALGADDPLAALGLTAVQDHMGLLFGHVRTTPKPETLEEVLEALCCWAAITESMEARSIPLPSSKKDWPVHLSQLGSTMHPKEPNMVSHLLGVCISRSPQYLAKVSPGSAGEYVLRNMFGSMLTVVGLPEVMPEEVEAGWRTMGADLFRVFNESQASGRQVFMQVIENALQGSTNLDMDLPELLTQLYRICMHTQPEAFPKRLSLLIASKMIEDVKDIDPEDLDIIEMMLLLARLHRTIAPTPLTPQVIWMFAQAIELKYGAIVLDEDDVTDPVKNALHVFEKLVERMLREMKQQKLDTSDLWQQSALSLRMISTGEHPIFGTGEPMLIHRGALLAARLLLQHANQHVEGSQTAIAFRECVAEILSTELADTNIPALIFDVGVEAEVLQLISLCDEKDQPRKSIWLHDLDRGKDSQSKDHWMLPILWSDDPSIMIAAAQISSCSGDYRALCRALYDVGDKFLKGTRPSALDYEGFSLFVNRHLASLPDLDKKSTLPDAVDLLAADTRYSDEDHAGVFLCILHALVTSGEGWVNTLNGSKLIAKLSELLLDENVYENCRRALSCIVTLLRIKHAKHSQHAIETILRTLTTMLSPQHTFNEANATRHLYTLITTTLQTILTQPVTRKHVRGRMHLLLPLLQNLLHILFVPHASVSPAWHTTTRPLEPREAQRLARILSAIADPSAGAVATSSRANSKAALTDETARAREYAARFAGPLLAELAACMLRGRWCADGVREALLPGVWAVIGGVARVDGGLEVLSAGLPSGAREVVRGLIGEWRRSGGG